MYVSCSDYLGQVSSGNAVSGSMQGAHGVTGRSVPRPMLGMQRMQAQNMAAYNLTSQAGMGGGMNPGGIPMQRGVNAQAHQQQQVSHNFVEFHYFVVEVSIPLSDVCSKVSSTVKKERCRNGNGWIPSAAETKTHVRYCSYIPSLKACVNSV